MPQWVNEYLPGESDLFEHRVKLENGPGRSWLAPSPDMKVKIVCRPCNNGWMSRVETEAKPALGSLIRGHGRTLYQDGQRAIAVWAIKTAMT